MKPKMGDYFAYQDDFSGNWMIRRQGYSDVVTVSYQEPVTVTPGSGITATISKTVPSFIFSDEGDAQAMAAALNVGRRMIGS